MLNDYDKKVKLLPIEKNHLESIQIWQNDYSISRYTSIDTFVPRNMFEEENWFTGQMALNNKRTYMISYLTEIVGFVSYSGLDLKNGVVFISIVIGNQKYRGKGIAKSAIKLIENYLKNEMNVRKITAKILCNNEPSIYLFESLKYSKEATLRKEVYRDGIFLDILIYTKYLREGW